MPFPPPSTTLKSWEGFESHLADLRKKGRWIYRGVLASWEPLTSLERARRSWDIAWTEVPLLEKRLARDFCSHLFRS